MLAVPTLLLAGCASEGSPNAGGSGTAAPSGSATGSASGTATPAAPVKGVPAAQALATVKVSGDAGKKPSVTLGTKPTQLSTSGVRVLKPGAGAVIAKGQNVTVDYVLLNGKDGKEADTTFGKSKVSFLADPGQLLPGLANGMIGQKVGSRVLVGVAPQDGFNGGAGNAQLGFGKDDPLIFVLDLASAVTPVPPLAKAAGTPVTPPAGLPTVKEDAKGVPVITMPKTAAPTTLVLQPLIKGEGAVVRKGQRIIASYVGAVYGTGKVFDSSFASGKKLEVPIGVGQLVPGFDKGIVGQTVGSRMLLVLPPAEGYGTTGNEQAGIKGTDTIVFVVDILAAT